MQARLRILGWIPFMLVLGCASDSAYVGYQEGEHVSSSRQPPVRQEPVSTWTPLAPYDALGRQNLAAGEPARAAYQYEEALKINPFDPVAINNLAVAEAEQGNYHTAVDLLSRAARLAPDDIEIAANLARLRNWVNNEALSGADPSARAGTVTDLSKLPPPPPELWNAQIYR